MDGAADIRRSEMGRERPAVKRPCATVHVSRRIKPLSTGLRPHQRMSALGAKLLTLLLTGHLASWTLNDRLALIGDMLSSRSYDRAEWPNRRGARTHTTISFTSCDRR